jgi:hypothetical protein
MCERVSSGTVGRNLENSNEKAFSVMHPRFLHGADKTLAPDGDAFPPGRFPATLVLGDCLIDQTPVIFLEGFQIRIRENDQTSLLVGQTNSNRN